jgi:hypothetical protein
MNCGHEQSGTCDNCRLNLYHAQFQASAFRLQSHKKPDNCNCIECQNTAAAYSAGYAAARAEAGELYRAVQIALMRLQERESYEHRPIMPGTQKTLAAALKKWEGK